MHFVLDVNETLSDLTPLGDVLERHGASRELAGAWFAGVLRDGFALSMHRRAPSFRQLAEESAATVLHGASGLQGDGAVERAVAELMAELGSLPVHSDVVPGLRALHGAGHTLTAFSNGAAESARGLLERAGVGDVVARVLSVEESGVWKPHPNAYARAADTLGVAPVKLTMVAVHPWDLDGAARAGYGTAWLDRRGTPWPASFTRPDRRVGRLAELA